MSAPASARREAVLGDITAQQVDVVVNAANASLLGGGGVDGAIHRAAGPSLLAECQELRRTTLPRGLSIGDAVATGAGHLPARWVVHTVGPNAHLGQRDPAQLSSCFTRSLEVASGLGASSIAFPAVSAGVFGWDVDVVARLGVDAVDAWLAEAGGSGGFELVRFVLFSAAALGAFEAALGIVHDDDELSAS